jgi:small subunit ribosomal protein S28e
MASNINNLNLIIQIILIVYYNHHMDSEPVKARVTQLLGRTGSRGGITQVKVTLISGKEADKRHLIRNVKGPVRIGDVLELMES